MAKIDIPSPIIDAIDSSLESTQDSSHRPHLGASLLGHKCDRYLWLTFRWTYRQIHSGRMLRLFARGQEEEERQVRYMEKAGMKVTRQQDRVTFSAHVSGSIDGVVTGVPGAEKTEHVWECKTHNIKSFNDLERKGVEKSKPMHYTQMQVYMEGLGLQRALYHAVCKDDDRIYPERVRLDKEHAEKAVARGIRITEAEKMPEPMSTDPSWYECQYCPARDLCHGGQPSREVNCRTCAHSTAMEDGWYCERWADVIPVEFQRTGCRSHVWHPDLVPWHIKGSIGDWTAIWDVDGAEIVNGEDGVESAQMLIMGGV